MISNKTKNFLLKNESTNQRNTQMQMDHLITLKYWLLPLFGNKVKMHKCKSVLIIIMSIRHQVQAKEIIMNSKRITQKETLKLKKRILQVLKRSLIISSSKLTKMTILKAGIKGHQPVNCSRKVSQGSTLTISVLSRSISQLKNQL